MNTALHDSMHKQRAAQLEQAAAASALAGRLRRTRRLDRAARWADAGARWSQRVSERLAARARASHARLP